MRRPMETQRRRSKLKKKGSSHRPLLDEPMTPMQCLQSTIAGAIVDRAQLLDTSTEVVSRKSTSTSRRAPIVGPAKCSSRRKSSKVSPTLEDDPYSTAHHQNDYPRTVVTSTLPGVLSGISMRSHESAAISANIRSQHSHSYSGVTLNNLVGVLSLTGEQLIFRPPDRRDRDNICAWQFDALQEHDISGAGSNACILKLTSHNHPTKPVTIEFPDRTSLESVHALLAKRLQPQLQGKTCKLKETLMITQRKLREANRSIDELQEINQKLLDSCEAFGRKCKSLRDELQEYQRNEVRQFVKNDKVAELEQHVVTLKPQVEELRNEKTAMTIGHEMDVEGYQVRIATLEQELAEERAALEVERAATERLLEDRELMDELQLEVHALTKELSSARRTGKEFRGKIEQSHDEMEEQERHSEELLWQVRRQRNNAYLELAHVKKDRDHMRDQLRRHQKELGAPVKRDLLVKQVVGQEEDESVLGLDCLSCSTLDETTQVAAKSNSKTYCNQVPRDALGGYLEAVLGPGNRPLVQDGDLDASSSVDSVVMPWRNRNGCVCAMTARMLISGNINESQSYPKGLLTKSNCSLVVTSENPPGSISSALGTSGGGCQTGFGSLHAVTLFTTADEPVGLTSSRPAVEVWNDWRWRPSPWWAWSRYQSDPNHASNASSSPYRFNGSSRIRVWRCQEFPQPCLPDGTLVGVGMCSVVASAAGDVGWEPFGSGGSLLVIAGNCADDRP